MTIITYPALAVAQNQVIYWKTHADFWSVHDG